MVKFVSRKSKATVLDLKRLPRNRDHKFRNNDIYINEHLTTRNKHLFNLAKDKKRSKNYKFLWTRNGKIFIRKDERSDPITIDCEDTISVL